MIASVDGRTAINDTSTGLGHPADTALLRAVRTAAEVILVGAGTLVAEGYANLLDDEQRAARVAAGRAPHPTVVTISRKLDIPDIPIAREDVPFVVYTEKRSGPGTFAGDGPGEVRVLPNASVEAVLDDLGPAAVLCEGGPHLLRQLAASDVLDEILVTVAPLITGGASSGLLAGDPLSIPLELSLVDAARADDHLFLHYRRGS
jgi:riboflavin biosynthesis pyrimidine reductase